MFLHLSVILFTGGVHDRGHARQGDMHGRGCVCGEEHAWQGHASFGGMHSGEMATEDTTNRSSQFSILSHCCEL